MSPPPGSYENYVCPHGHRFGVVPEPGRTIRCPLCGCTDPLTRTDPPTETEGQRAS